MRGFGFAALMAGAQAGAQAAATLCELFHASLAYRQLAVLLADLLPVPDAHRQSP
jgi:hypothetical protein